MSKIRKYMHGVFILLIVAVIGIVSFVAAAKLFGTVLAAFIGISVAAASGYFGVTVILHHDYLGQLFDWFDSERWTNDDDGWFDFDDFDDD